MNERLNSRDLRLWACIGLLASTYIFCMFQLYVNKPQNLVCGMGEHSKAHPIDISMLNVPNGSRIALGIFLQNSAMVDYKGGSLLEVDTFSGHPRASVQIVIPCTREFVSIRTP